MLANGTWPCYVNSPDATFVGFSLLNVFRFDIARLTEGLLCFFVYPSDLRWKALNMSQRVNKSQLHRFPRPN